MLLPIIALAFHSHAVSEGTQRCGPVDVQGVAWSVENPKYLEAWVRTRGTLPEGGVWSLKIVHITQANGSPIRSRWPIESHRPGSARTISQLRLLDPFPGQARVEGELVHYQTIEETANFPVVDLKMWRGLPSGSKSGDTPANREWEIPTQSLGITTYTPRGLCLGFYGFRYAGGSGPVYDDTSLFPVRVIPTSLNSGISRVGRPHLGSEERVDAYVNPIQPETIYQKEPPIDGAVFAFHDKDFSPHVNLSLHVTRMFVDKWYPFALTVPVQKGKNPFEEHQPSPDRSKMLVWPK